MIRMIIDWEALTFLIFNVSCSRIIHPWSAASPPINIVFFLRFDSRCDYSQKLAGRCCDLDLAYNRTRYDITVGKMLCRKIGKKKQGSRLTQSQRLGKNLEETPLILCSMCSTSLLTIIAVQYVEIYIHIYSHSSIHMCSFSFLFIYQYFFLRYSKMENFSEIAYFSVSCFCFNSCPFFHLGFTFVILLLPCLQPLYNSISFATAMRGRFGINSRKDFGVWIFICDSYVNLLTKLKTTLQKNISLFSCRENV